MSEPRYYLQMSKVAVVGLVASGLLALTGCTDSAAKACEVVVKTKIEYQDLSKELHSKYLKLIEASLDDGEGTIEDYERIDALNRKHLEAKKDSKSVIINNPTCFSPKQVVEAQKIYEETKFLLDN
jgi:hypothetical protein